MLYLQVKQVHKSFTERPLLTGVDFSIQKGQKVALVAKNGAGKSTLIKILEGHIEVAQGEVSFHKNITVGFLAQTFDAPEDMTVWDAIFLHKSHMGQLIKKYEILLTESDDQELIHDTLQEIQEGHGREYEVKVKSIMSQLQLTSFADKPMGSLSGGEAKRVALAKALIDEPDFLVLDEPTNHLDLEMIEWLERYLKKTSMTLLMVTHDRYFLERVCTDIYELDRGKVYSYKGNYENFLIKKAEREELEQLNVHKLKQYYKRELAWIRKAPRARESKAVDREKDFYRTEADFKARKKRLSEQAMKLEFSVQKRRLGSKILKIHKLNKSFGDKVILKDFTHNFKEGERVGIMGKNGAGKSTFMNILAGLEGYDSGKMDFGVTVKVGYYKQKHALIDSDKSVLAYVRAISDRIVVARGVTLSATKLLERFLFTPRQQQMKVSSLSGGEKRRLHLLTVLIDNPNFLILDEPTNDLDLVTLAVLEEFLLAYQGCLIIISHDRFFMDKLVDHMFVFEGDGELTDFRGTYSEYKSTKKAETLAQKEKEAKLAKPEPEKPKPKFATTPKKLTYKEKTEFEQLNKDIHALEERKHEINALFQQEGFDPAHIKELGKELNILVAELEVKEARWMELADRA